MTNYYGNSTLGFDADEFAPDALLDCPSCHAQIAYYGDIEFHISTLLTLGEDVLVVCQCGATYGCGDTLEIINEDTGQCEGFGCVDGCQDCAPRCPFCGAPTHARMCEPQREAMADDASDVTATLDRLTAIVDKHGTVDALREQLATAHEVVAALLTNPYHDEALDAARTWLRREAR